MICSRSWCGGMYFREVFDVGGRQGAAGVSYCDSAEIFVAKDVLTGYNGFMTIESCLGFYCRSRAIESCLGFYCRPQAIESCRGTVIKIMILRNCPP